MPLVLSARNFTHPLLLCFFFPFPFFFFPPRKEIRFFSPKSLCHSPPLFPNLFSPSPLTARVRPLFSCSTMSGRLISFSPANSRLLMNPRPFPPLSFFPRRGRLISNTRRPFQRRLKAIRRHGLTSLFSSAFSEKHQGLCDTLFLQRG